MTTTRNLTSIMDNLIKPYYGLELTDSNRNPHGWTPAKGLIEGIIKNYQYSIDRIEMNIAEKVSDIKQYVFDNNADHDNSADFKLIELNEHHTKLTAQKEQYEDDILALKLYYKQTFGVEYAVRKRVSQVSATPKQRTQAIAYAQKIVQQHNESVNA